MESWGHFPASRRRLLELLRDTKPAAALLVSGDVHYAEMLGAAAAPAGILEFTSSGLNRSCGSKGGVSRFMCEAILRIWHAHREPHDGVSGEVGAATPLGGASVEINFGTISFEWSSSSTAREADTIGSAIIQAHGVDGTPLLRHRLPLGLGGQLEARRWEAALDMPTIFDEAHWLRLPLIALMVIAVQTLFILVCYVRCRARPSKQHKHRKAA